MECILLLLCIVLPSRRTTVNLLLPTPVFKLKGFALQLVPWPALVWLLFVLEPVTHPPPTFVRARPPTWDTCLSSRERLHPEALKHAFPGLPSSPPSQPAVCPCADRGRAGPPSAVQVVAGSLRCCTVRGPVRHRVWCRSRHAELCQEDGTGRCWVNRQMNRAGHGQ